MAGESASHASFLTGATAIPPVYTLWSTAVSWGEPPSDLVAPYYAGPTMAASEAIGSSPPAIAQHSSELSASFDTQLRADPVPLDPAIFDPLLAEAALSVELGPGAIRSEERIEEAAPTACVESPAVPEAEATSAFAAPPSDESASLATGEEKRVVDDDLPALEELQEVAFTELTSEVADGAGARVSVGHEVVSVAPATAAAHDLAARLEAIASRLRTDGTAAVVAGMRGDRFDALLAGLFAGYLAARDLDS